MFQLENTEVIIFLNMKNNKHMCPIVPVIILTLPVPGVNVSPKKDSWAVAINKCPRENKSVCFLLPFVKDLEIDKDKCDNAL